MGSLTSTDGNIIGFSYGFSGTLSGQDIGGTGQFAFIDKGNGEGVSAGQYVAIFQTPGNLFQDSESGDLPEDYQQVGVIRIIDTTDAGAVGYIVQNSQELRIGDRAGKKGG